MRAWSALARTGLAFALLAPTLASAFELRPLYRSARATAMGGAYVALADDEAAIFLNPAGLAGGIDPSMHYALMDVDASYDSLAAYQVLGGSSSAFSASTLNSLLGYDSYFRAQITPTWIFKNFGFSILVDGQGGLYARNQSLPYYTFGYQVTNGFQAAFGFKLQGGRQRSTSQASEFRVGAALKYLFRRGGYQLMPQTTFLRLSQGSALLSELVGDFGVGYGMDLGLQWIKPITKRTKFQLGAAWTDISDTTFTGRADAIPNNLSIGAALKYSLGSLSTITLAYDYANILQSPLDWRQRNHWGFEWKIGTLDIYAGLNQVFFTYGAAFDIWLLRFTALSYAQELDTVVKQDPNRRYMVKFDFKVGL